MNNTLPGAVAWFTFEDRNAVARTVLAMQGAGIREIRTAFSWADWERPGGPAWFDYFIGELAEAGIKLLPCLFYTPLTHARRQPGKEPKTSYPPERLEDYSKFLTTMIGRYGNTFEWVHLWNESNWDVYWNWEMDPEWKLFAEMISPAITIAHDSHKRVALGGLSPYDAEWVHAMFDYGVMQHADALGIHAFPGTWPEDGPRRKGRPWKGLAAEIEEARAQLRKNKSNAEVWLTETGYSTFGVGEEKKQREQQQVDYFCEALSSPADRIYWHTMIDQSSGTPTDNELNSGLERDDRAYHFGIIDAHGNPKPLYYYWRDLARVTSSIAHRY
jgi:CDP-paratose 2-epimerase